MQRLFSMFPDRGPGVGLLLLRVALAVALWQSHTPGSAAWTGVALAAGLLLMSGWITPLALLLACAHALAHLALDQAPTLLLIAGMALLGPGAYSLDARRFGRRVLRPAAPSPERGSGGRNERG
ncbi:hypothetical protein [Pseudoxanthomonas winnipegensis]|jgi:hypothetical protein|uniref:Uncharacterized protein n=1 Tax=Pseudoxanthomonas winnipegensis TaxID=2480810 RepID=A0A4Q8LDC6_9GAMM|nr:hypothetical protein [Pseudoxanthomonas winnipegensis]TAA26898.1 hypothetical protein EA660_06705 [Pseudoxanthomonas winnipegensis]